MRRVEASGGLELGPQHGPWIDIIRLNLGRPVQLAEAEELALDPETTWRRLPREGRRAMPDGVGIAGMNSRAQVALRFLRPRKTNDTVALRRIAEVDRIPPAIAGAVLAAATSLRQREELPGMAPATIARACALQPAGPETTMNSQEIQELARRFPLSLATDLPVRGLPASAGQAGTQTGANVDLPTGSVDRARFWLAAARILWEPDVLQQVGRSRPDFRATLMASRLAASYAWLTELRDVDLPGGTQACLCGARRQAYLPDDPTRSLAWPQALELAADGIPAEALAWFNGGRLPAADPTVDRAFHESAPVPPTPNPDLARALAQQFLDEAEDGVYAPAGAFEVEIPEDLHLANWGVRRLKVRRYRRGRPELHLPVVARCRTAALGGGRAGGTGPASHTGRVVAGSAGGRRGRVAGCANSWWESADDVEAPACAGHADRPTLPPPDQAPATNVARPALHSYTGPADVGHGR